MIVCMREAEADRFWAKVNKAGPLPEYAPEIGVCWLWTAYIEPRGYGVFRPSGCSTNVKAHRWAYEALVGSIPAGLTLDHLCRVRHCVNPTHLEPVTNRENGLRGNTVAAINARKTHCVNGHEFTPENTTTRSDGGRRCQICLDLQGLMRTDRGEVRSGDMTVRRATIKARDGKGRMIRTVETVRRDQQAAELRSQSKTYREIGAILGCSESTAYDAVCRGMLAVPTEASEQQKKLELLKYDRRERRMNLILNGPVTPEQAIAASNALDRVQRRRAALLGLDAPTRIRIEEVPEETVDSEILRLEAELAKNGPMPADDVG